MILRPNHHALGLALHEALLAGWPFCWVSTREETGISPGADLRELNEGAGFWAEELLKPIDGLRRGQLAVLFTTRPSSSDSWVRDLWEREGVILTESPPCAFTFGEGILVIGDDERPVRDLHITVEKSRWPEGSPPLMEQVLGGRLLAEELEKIAAPMDPEPSVPRYGPHPTDPYARGTRRRRR